MKNTKPAIERVVIATGIASVTAQLVTIREFLALFSGNEFVIALILFMWLIAGGIGSLAANLIESNKFPPLLSKTALGLLSLLLSVFPVIQIVSIRLFYPIFFTYGVSAGFYQTTWFTVVATAPYAGLVGFVLPVSLYIIRNHVPDYRGARIYILDNAGDVTGGALFSLLLVYLVSPLTALVVSGLPLFVCACQLFPRKKRITAFVSGCFCASIFVVGIVIEHPSISPPLGTLVRYQESKYGRILILKDNEQYTLYRDGCPAFSSHDTASAERIVHFPLSQIEHPKTILLLSIQSGIIEELMKYSPDRVDYVETDPEITSSLLKFNMITKANFLNITNMDAANFLRSSTVRYDAIIISLPEPNTFQLNRFFTDDFYTLAKSRLSLSGVLAFSMTGYDNYLSEQRRRKVSTMYNTAANTFNHVLMLPGQTITFLCANRPLNSNIPALLDDKQINTVYIRNYYSGNVTQRRIDYLTSLIDPGDPINQNNRPVLVNITIAEWFEKHHATPYLFAGVTGLMMIILLRTYSRQEFLLFTTGFTTMGSELLVIFTCQIVFGYIYFLIGIVVTVFLAGLMPGAWLATSDRFRMNNRKKLILSDLAIITLLGLFIAAIHTPFLRNAIFFYLTFGFSISLVCGFQFPVATEDTGDKNTTVTRAFSSDLCGAAFGVMVTSGCLLPLLGTHFTVLALLAVKLLSLTVNVGYHGKPV